MSKMELNELLGDIIQAEEIEEMTEVLCAIECKGMKCDSCDHYGCEYSSLAEALYNVGYRRASDVAREIFAELETKAPWFCENQTAYEHFNEELAELKKKYLEDGE